MVIPTVSPQLLLQLDIIVTYFIMMSDDTLYSIVYLR